MSGTPHTPGVHHRAFTDAVDLADHRANVARYRVVVIVALFVWIGLIPADALMAWVVVPGPFWVYVAIRLLVLPVLVGAMWRLGSAPLATPRALTLLDVMVISMASWGVSAMCVVGGGLWSPYVTGLCCVVVGRGLALAHPWHRGALGNLPILVGHPAILAIGALFVPEVAEQWRDPSSVGALVASMSLVASTTLLAVWGADAHWRLRREVLRSQSIGRYELLERLGSGGMGEVWRARAQGVKQDVAVKVVPDTRLAEPGALQRFEREVEALSALHHPNTVRVFDYGVSESGMSYYAMELLHGRTLHEVVRQLGPLPPKDAVTVLTQVASAMGEAHDKGIVHRDLKPRNLMLVDAGPGVFLAKVLDFGVARLLDAPQATRIGAVVGTPKYLSPEAAAGKEVGPPADVYAMGCLLFFMLTGQPPFTGDTVDLLQAHRTRPPPRLSDVLAEPAPEALEAVLARCLAKDPADRFPNGHALARALSAPVEDRAPRPVPGSVGDDLTIDHLMGETPEPAEPRGG